MRCVSEREWAIQQFFIVKSVFYASVLLCYRLMDPQVLWQCCDKIHDQWQDRCLINWCRFVNWKTNNTTTQTATDKYCLKLQLISTYKQHGDDHNCSWSYDHTTFHWAAKMRCMMQQGHVELNLLIYFTCATNLHFLLLRRSTALLTMVVPQNLSVRDSDSLSLLDLGSRPKEREAWVNMFVLFLSITLRHLAASVKTPLATSTDNTFQQCHACLNMPFMVSCILVSGLKVNDQLVAFATRFLAVRLKNHVWSHHHALKAKVQCDFPSAYSPDHSNILRLINIINIRYNIIRRVFEFYSSSLSLISHWILRTQTLFFSAFCDVNNYADTCKWTNEARAPCAKEQSGQSFSLQLERVCVKSTSFLFLFACAIFFNYKFTVIKRMCGAFLLSWMMIWGNNSRKWEVKLLSLSFGST